MGKLDAGLIGEYMILGAFVHALENQSIGDYAARVEVLDTVEDDVIAVTRDLEVQVAWVDGAWNVLLESNLDGELGIAWGGSDQLTFNEPILLDDLSLDPVLLLVRTNHARRRRPPGSFGKLEQSNKSAVSSLQEVITN